jgi:hypothetical protein
VSVVLLIAALVNYVWPSKEVLEELTGLGCVRRIITDIASDRRDKLAHTKEAMLRMVVLQGLDRATVFAKLKLSGMEGAAVWLQARREFRMRLMRLREDLSRYLEPQP